MAYSNLALLSQPSPANATSTVDECELPTILWWQNNVRRIIKLIVNSYLQSWFARKASGMPYRIKRSATVIERVHKSVGPRSIYGEVTLSAAPATDFSYMSAVRWPTGEQVSLYEDCVLDGILDTLFTHRHNPILGLSVTLDSIGWHDIDSCAIGYYQAARQAMLRILDSEPHRWNYEPISSADQ